MERRIDDATVRILQADITTLDVDAIVNAANTELWMGGGVAGAIKRRGGESIEQEATAQGPIRVGETVITRAGTLPARAVIHAATMGPDLTTNDLVIRHATRSALAVAAERQWTSIALPALGTGVGGFPLDRAAAVMVDELIAHLRGGTTLRDVILAVWGGEAEAAFRRALEDATATPRSPEPPGSPA
ncbi:MAG TPA: macro domain-containing protein [bacterium]|jgi:O-acetyl-ADP-ribose deacetylase (regulator of RNase III)|nr:macro domain-containing protein [bacterium]